jgi:hypothetical protein
MKIGIVDLDTSHPKAWIPIIRDLGHEIVGLWDGGSVHPESYVEAFAEENEIPEVCDTLEDLVTRSDAGIIYGCDWDTHVDKARPFVEAGKGVLIDKPMAGSVKDLDQLQKWAEEGAKITGGSSLRFCYETRDWMAKPVDDRGTPNTVVCGCGVDELNYGIHAYSMMAGILGTGASSVQSLGKGVQRRIQINWDDGRSGILVVGQAEAYLPFYALITTEKGVSYLQADNKPLYRALLEKTLPYLAGEVQEPPNPHTSQQEPERWALAARVSWLNENAVIRLDALESADPGYDGAHFAEGYRKSRYPDA